MRTIPFKLLAALLFLLGPDARADAPSPPERASFRRQVAPILVKRCLACHDDRKASGGLSLATFAALERGARASARRSSIRATRRAAT